MRLNDIDPSAKHTIARDEYRRHNLVESLKMKFRKMKQKMDIAKAI